MCSHKRMGCGSASRGVAAVETAVVLPLVVLLILGAVDIGQFANCHQKVSEASREGGRYAAQCETTNVADVETVVFTCLGDMFPSVPETTLRSGTTVAVCRADGSAITGSDLESVSSGSLVEVNVTLQFSTVRWISGLTFLGGRSVQTATAMRRE
jgi:Flp pilus assembly protein TadG